MIRRGRCRPCTLAGIGAVRPRRLLSDPPCFTTIQCLPAKSHPKTRTMTKSANSRRSGSPWRAHKTLHALKEPYTAQLGVRSLRAESACPRSSPEFLLVLSTLLFLALSFLLSCLFPLPVYPLPFPVPFLPFPLPFQMASTYMDAVPLESIP